MKKREIESKEGAGERYQIGLIKTKLWELRYVRDRKKCGLKQL